MKNFLAFDGEAIDGQYKLMCCSDGSHLLSDTELTTKQCLDYLLSRARPNTVHICYGLNYDVNQWICNLPEQALKQLWLEKRCTWRDYKIRWIPRREFSVRDGTSGKRVSIYEPLGFFQSKFVTACEDWGVPIDADMATMKGLRGTFEQKDIDRTIHYCKQECFSLVNLMQALYRACVEARILPKRWYGAGSLAQTMLINEGIQEHHKHDTDLLDDPTPILCAYKGARVEQLRIGDTNGAEGADIISAYPSTMRHLPSLADATLTPTNRYDPTDPYAIWHVKWHDLPGRIMPFSFRYKKMMYYPRTGEGWVHACEVRAARQVFGQAIEVTSGYKLTSPHPIQPFTWVAERFKQREKWKKEGHAGQKILKLGLNSLYGKTAQGIGFRGKPPRFQSYYWAGMITAQTRTKMFLAALQSTNPIMITTDGLYAEHLPISDKPGLGGWEKSYYDRFFAIQAGVYEAKPKDGEVFYRSRGFRASDVSYDGIREGFNRWGIDYVHFYRSHLFNGLGSCTRYSGSKLIGFNRDRWRTWTDSEQKIVLEPNRKDVGPDGELLPPAFEFGESEPYEPKSSGIDDAADEQNLLAFDQPDPHF